MEKHIYRSKSSKIFAGVCGGLAEYFDIDPVLVRALFVILLLGDGISFILYIVLWFIMPKGENKLPPDDLQVYSENSDPIILDDGNPVSSYSQDELLIRRQRRSILGIFLIILGVILLLSHMINFAFMSDFWPALLVLAGIVLLCAAFFYKKGNRNEKV